MKLQRKIPSGIWFSGSEKKIKNRGNNPDWRDGEILGIVRRAVTNAASWVA